MKVDHYLAKNNDEKTGFNLKWIEPQNSKIKI